MCNSYFGRLKEMKIKTINENKNFKNYKMIMKRKFILYFTSVCRKINKTFKI